MKTCASCLKSIPGDQFLTEVNPEGGYGNPQVLVCDDCMASEDWADWRSRKWKNWPDQPRVFE